ncbi:hypothetical protein SSX86_008432 [Deinandra increscens subsp. villosa]|uniref:F-box domain-containing protein n=1 Tax=Deinandra increscens subsp. villosa TaxID=3103831 RepID=A0AAP0H6T8_9ASTR
MDKLPYSLLLQILSRLDDSADVARCRVASKAFDAVFPDHRSINLLCSVKWYINSRSRVSSSQHIKPFKAVILDLISRLITVESVSISVENPILCVSHHVVPNRDDFYLTDGDFAKEWLPRVSGSLKSLSLSGLPYYSTRRQSDVLPLISAYCYNLVNLRLKFGWLSVHNVNPMPMLTSLTLESVKLEDEQLNELNKCFPNLQNCNLLSIAGLKYPKINLLKLKTCHCSLNDTPLLTLITPDLITLKIEHNLQAALHIEAPLLSNFYLGINASLLSMYFDGIDPAYTFTVKNFENLETLWLKSSFIGSLLSEFPITETVENLTLESTNSDATDSKFILGKVFTVFPNVSSLCIVDGRNGLKTIRVYLMLDDDDPSSTFSSVAYVLDQCVGLLEVLLLIHDDVIGPVSESFRSKCRAHWPGFNWRWGIWNKHLEDSWMT